MGVDSAEVEVPYKDVGFFIGFLQGFLRVFCWLQVGLIQQGLTEAERRTAYAADVTYVTNSELGFDYLRDNLAQRGEDLVLRAFNFCVIDEVDSILIGESRDRVAEGLCLGFVV